MEKVVVMNCHVQQKVKVGKTVTKTVHFSIAVIGYRCQIKKRI